MTDYDLITKYLPCMFLAWYKSEVIWSQMTQENGNWTENRDLLNPDVSTLNSAKAWPLPATVNDCRSLQYKNNTE